MFPAPCVTVTPQYISVPHLACACNHITEHADSFAVFKCDDVTLPALYHCRLPLQLFCHSNDYILCPILSYITKYV